MLNKQVNQHIKLSLLTLLIYASFASFGAVLPTPALPDIASYFKLSHGVEWVMSIYLIGYALGQLLYGPIAKNGIADKYSELLRLCTCTVR